VPTKNFDGGLEKDKTVTIGIDQSLTGFAFCAIDVDDLSKHMTWVYKSPYQGVERLVDIRQWLVDHLGYIEEQGHSIVDVAMEGTVLASHAALVLGELSATVRLALFDYCNDCPTQLPLKVPPMTLKKFASGKGNSKKQEMMLQIYKRWGVELTDDNAADAYSLARLAAGIYNNSGMGAIETAVIEQMKDLKYRDQKSF
jgi:crossover junction endodeoxyribonuclease RuvC